MEILASVFQQQGMYKVLRSENHSRIEKFIISINQFNGADLISVAELLQNWELIFTENMIHFQRTNRENNSESRTQKENELIQRLHDTQQAITTLIPAKGEVVNSEAS